MNHLNSVVIEGFLSADPIYNISEKGTAVLTFCITTRRFYKEEDATKEESSILLVQTFGKLADVCKKHLSKGSGVRVIGRLKQEKYNDCSMAIKIVAEHVEFKLSINKKDGSYGY